MRISVVVIAKNEEKCIENCLKSLRAQTLKPEIIVVDGHSTDRTVPIARKYADKVVKDNKKGISDARNVGFKTAKGDVVAYCDADCLPREDWTKSIMEIIGGNLAVSGPLMAYDGSTKLKISFKIWTDMMPRFLSLLGCNFLWGANMAFRKSILMTVPFRTKFLEDYDIRCRLRKIGSIKFSKKMTMSASTRRFKASFYRNCLKYYFMNILKIRLGFQPGDGYYNC